MPHSGLMFEKETNPLSQQILRLFEETRAAYLSARQDPKQYSKDWQKALESIIDAYEEVGALSSDLKESISEKDLESTEAKNAESHTASNIYRAIKEIRYSSKNVKDPFSKKFGDQVLEKLLEDKDLLAVFIHWIIRSSKKALPIQVWEKYLPKGDEITNGYEGLDLHSKDISSYITEHYGDEKNTQSVKGKVKAAMKLLESLYLEHYSETEWKDLLGLDIAKAEKAEIDFLIPNKPMYRIFDIDDINELRGFTGEWVVQEKYDGMRIQIHKIDGKVKIYSFNEKDITDKCPKQVKILKEKKFGECILDAELMLFENDKPLHRAQVVAHVFKDKKTDGELKIHVFDIMRHNERDMAEEALKERIQMLFQNYAMHSDELLAFPSKKDTRIADSLKDVETYAKEIMKIPTAEGVVIKDIESTYIKGARKNPKWIKWKKFVDLDLLVLDKKSTKSNLHSYTLGAGPMQLEEARKLDSEKVNDRYYLNVGKALNTKIDVDVGSIVRVKVDEVKRNSKGQYRIYSAKIVEIPEVTEPDKVITLQLLAGEKEAKKYKAKALEKSIIITDDIHGETEIILKEDLQGFTVYGFKNDNLMTKNALLDIDVWKEQAENLYKERRSIIRVGIKNWLQEQGRPKSEKEILAMINKDKKLSERYNEVFGKNVEKFRRYLRSQEDLIYEGKNNWSADSDILEKTEYKTPEEYRKGEFKLYKRKDENLSLTFLLNDVKLGWEIQIDSDDNIFDLFGKAGKYPAQVQTTVSKEKLIDEGDIELGVQRHGYHEYFLKGKKFDTKLHLRVVPLKEQKQWIAFSSFVKEAVEPSSDDGIWNIREDKNKDLSFTSLE
tara:strand:+ start:8144 stop:10654 length:2511 start_codon:yes stop_codon:yes gene_type:complete